MNIHINPIYQTNLSDQDWVKIRSTIADKSNPFHHVAKDETQAHDHEVNSPADTHTHPRFPLVSSSPLSSLSLTAQTNSPKLSLSPYKLFVSITTRFFLCNYSLISLSFFLSLKASSSLCAMASSLATASAVTKASGLPRYNDGNYKNCPISKVSFRLSPRPKLRFVTPKVNLTICISI